MAKKNLFMISVIDQEGSLNRRYADTMLWLLNSHSDFCNEYEVELHNSTINTDLYKSLDEAIQKDVYEGYIVILDCLDTEKGLFNPNVMFEFGGIKNLDKPFSVMAINNHPSDFPFDVKNINVGFIPDIIRKYILDAYENIAPQDVREWFNELSERDKTIILDFFSAQYKKFESMRKKKKKETARNEQLFSMISELTESHKKLNDEVRKITNYVSNTAEYIDGESAAFSALSEAVRKAKYSLRTSRFANQSIVVKSTREQESFMVALYEASSRLKEKAVRIICNNHPTKWHDIYNILFYGGSGSRVYVRKADFSIHFEMVVIDESVAFIHFYQQVHSDASGRGKDNRQIEKLNSTLKIQGSSLCQKFAKIYDRLHHRDVEAGTFMNPSRTLLGVDIDHYEANGDEDNIGYFVLEDEIYTATRHKTIISMFKNAFKSWHLSTRDKINMAAGIALLDQDEEFLTKMRDENKMTKEEYNQAKELFDLNNHQN